MSADPRRVKELFGAALAAADRSERDALLERECGGDADLRRRVDALLRAHDHPKSALDRPLAAAAPEPDRTADHRRTAAADVGDVVDGRYKLLERIGEGGMGEVWVADQGTPVRRRVALKMIKPGMDSRAVLARFEAERQALALMDHPNVAKVFEAGTAADGRPYFVMELVKGTPITEFCDARTLSFRERLELFVPVCHAIHHAHQKGVIHRDIKPHNVLVALHDERAVPKVIDFGVAKAVGQQLTEKTVYTGFGTLVGTPAYMAPEQATFNQLDVDTRADVYALGVLLYELMAGSPPFEPERLRKAAIDEVLRVVREEEPPRPSARLSTSQAKATIAATRRADPDALARLMRGELDWIVMKSLEKDRGRRYDSAAGLAKDVERYLRDEPVEACPPTLGYRVRKAYRKNRAAVITTAAVLAGALVAVAGQTWNLLRARDAEARAVVAGRAEAEQRAEAVTAGEKAARERDAAAAARNDLRRALYAASLNLVAAAWEADNVPRVIELLDEQRPKPGEEDLRGFEWHYWDRLAHAARRTWSFADDKSVGAVISGDGRRVAAWACTEDGGKPGYRVRVADAATGREVFAVTLPRPDTLALVGDGRLALDRDGTRLAFTHRVGGVEHPDGRLVVYDVDNKTVVYREEGPIDRKTALSPDGTRLAVVGFPAKRSAGTPYGVAARITVRSLADPDRPPVVIENDEPGSALTDAPRFSPDGSRLAAVSMTGSWQGRVASSVRVWDAAAGRSEVRHPLTGEQALGVAFTPDGERLVTVGMKAPAPGARDLPKTFVTLWSAADGRLTPVHSTPVPLAVPSVPALHFAFSPDGRRLALSNGFQPAQLLDVEGGSVLRAVKAATGILAAAFTADGGRLLTLRSVPGNVPAAVPDGTLQEWDVATPAPPRRDRGTVWSADRTRQATFARPRVLVSGVYAPKADPAVTVRDRSGKELTVFRKHTSTVLAAFLSPDGRWVLSNSSDEVILWRADTGEVGWTRKVAGDGTFYYDGRDGGEFSPDGRWVALRDVGETRVVAAADLKDRFRTGPSADVRFSPDGRRLVTFHRGPAGPDGKRAAGAVKVWDTEAGMLVEATPWPDGLARPTVFAAGGRAFAVAGSSAVVVFDPGTGKPRATLPAAAELGRVVLSPDGARLVMVRKDGFGRYGDDTAADPVPVWDTATGKPVCHLKGHASPVRDAVFSPDGTRIATSGAPKSTLAGEFRIWDAASGAELLWLPHLIGYVSPVRLTFSPDGHRLTLTALNPIPGRDPEQIWDATPRPEGEQP